jgi:hypothetical protein
VSEDDHDNDVEVPSRHSRTRGCPDWCVECMHEPVRDGAFWHRGPATTISVFGGTTRPIPLTIRAGYMDKLPKDWGTEPADLEKPYITMDVPDESRMFTLTPVAAYEMAAALTSAADAANAAHRAATQAA